MDTTRPNVLVRVTGDHEIDAALDYAAADAMRRGCGVHLVHVQHPGYIGRSAAVELRMIDGELRKAGVDVLERAAGHVDRLVDETVPASTELVRGVVVSSLVAASQHACLVVLQNHRKPMLARVSALSVTGGVAARANAPVAVIPASWQRPDVYPGAVVVGVEEALSSHDVVRVALDEARRTHSRVRQVQCWWISRSCTTISSSGITPALRTRRGSTVTLRRTSRRSWRSTPTSRPRSWWHTHPPRICWSASPVTPCSSSSADTMPSSHWARTSGRSPGRS